MVMHSAEIFGLAVAEILWSSQFFGPAGYCVQFF